MPDSAPAALLCALRALAREQGGALTWFADRMAAGPTIATAPCQLPACQLLTKLPALASAETRPTVDALIAASDALRWQQSYTEADGFSPDYLARYGWINLASPEGLFAVEDIRISIGFWGAGLDYAWHAHAPEEVYLVLAGAARFHAEGRAPRIANAGDIVHHAPHQRHRIEMRPGPLLAAAFWRGEALLAKSEIG